jgi:hypothetical protein
MPTHGHLPGRYLIGVDAHLDPSWSDWFDGLTVEQHDDGTTSLTGEVVDQAALYGLLGRLRDLGATLLSVQRLDHADTERPHETGDPR